MSFICKRCGYNASTKQALERHLNRKVKCVAIPQLQDVPNETLLHELHIKHDSKKFACICQTRFSHNSSLCFHKKTCSAALQHDNKNQNINSLTHEGVSYLDCGLLFNCFKHMDLQPLVASIHFHPDHPENHNIRVKNVRLNYMEYLSNGSWIVAHKRVVLPMLIENACIILETYRCRYSGQLSKEMGKDKYLESLVWIKKHGPMDLDKQMYSSAKKSLYNLCV